MQLFSTTTSAVVLPHRLKLISGSSRPLNTKTSYRFMSCRLHLNGPLSIKQMKTKNIISRNYNFSNQNKKITYFSDTEG